MCTFKGCRAPNEYPNHTHPTNRGDELIITRENDSKIKEENLWRLSKIK